MSSAAPSIDRTIIMTGLVLAVVLVFGQAASFEFVHYDDNAYVFANPHVRDGLTPASIYWAVTSTENSLWLPLTRLSYLIDSELAGLNAGWFHGINVALHALNTILLYWVLRGLTGSVWRSAAAAMLFSVHPLRVESVAWVTERKDMLSMCMLLLSLMAYQRSARTKSGEWYAGSVALFGASLMAKPMAVMYPVLLLILDRWPLGRWGVEQTDTSGKSASKRRKAPGIRTLITEKVPFAVHSVCIALITVSANRGALKPDDVVPLMSRLANAVVSPVRYLFMMVWPVDFTFYYPYEPSWLSPAAVAGSLGVLAVITTACMAVRRRAPYCLAGWIWYLIALIPVLGFVQAGSQSHADRFTYLPMIGIAVLAVWGVYDLTRRLTSARNLRIALFVVAVTPLMVLSARQARTWRSSEALFSHAVAVTDNNYIAHLNYANLLLSSGDLTDAVVQYREAIRLRPTSGPAHFNMGTIMLRAGRYADAIAYFTTALPQFPDNPVLRRNLATAHDRLGNTAESARYATEAERLEQQTGSR